jgi:hypothetical protein
MTQDEFSAKFNTVYGDLVKFIFWMAHKIADDDNVMLGFDDVVSELNEEMVKGVWHYNDVPYKQLLIILRQMLSNRVSELRYRHHVTHRKGFKITISIECETEDGEDLSDIIPSHEGNPEALMLSNERVNEVRVLLSPGAKSVFDVLIDGDERMSWLTWLSCVRANARGKGFANAKIQPWIVGDVTGMSVKEVKSAFDEISRVYAKIGG